MKIFKDLSESMKFFMKSNTAEVLDFYENNKQLLVHPDNEDCLISVIKKVNVHFYEKEFQKICKDIYNYNPRVSDKIYNTLGNNKETKKFYLSLLENKEYDFIFHLLKDSNSCFIENLMPDKFLKIPEKYIFNYFCNIEEKKLNDKYAYLRKKISDKDSTVMEQQFEFIIHYLIDKNIKMSNICLMQLFASDNTRELLLNNSNLVNQLYNDKSWREKYDFFMNYDFFIPFLEKKGLKNQGYIIPELILLIEKDIDYAHLDQNLQNESIGNILNKRKITKI